MSLPNIQRMTQVSLLEPGVDATDFPGALMVVSSRELTTDHSGLANRYAWGREASIAEADFGDGYDTKDAEAPSDSEYASDMNFDRMKLAPRKLAGCQVERAEYNALINKMHG